MNQHQKESASLGFPSTYWMTNTFALFEQAAFFAVVPLAVIAFHEVLGMSPILSTLLNGTVFWGLIYFLPILTGAIIHKFGLKRMLAISFFFLSLGYILIGNIRRIWPVITGAPAGRPIDYTIPVILGILLLGLGKSLAKTGTAGSISHSSGNRHVFGLGIFYLVLNIGAIGGRCLSYILRTRGLELFPLKHGGYFIHIRPELMNIFAFTAATLSLLGLFLVIFIYRETEITGDEKKGAVPETLSRLISGIFLVVRNSRFLLFLLFASFAWILFAQIFNLVPLFLRFIDPRAPVEIYTLVTPITVVTFQIMLTKLMKRVKTNSVILIGTMLSMLGMIINIIPALWLPDISKKIFLWGIMIPVGGIFILISLAFFAFGEMLLVPAMIDYVSDIAPLGKEKLFQRYANLPVFLGTILGAPVGGILFEFGINTPLKNGTAPRPVWIWVILGTAGFIAWIGFLVTNRLAAGKIRSSENPE